MSEARDASLRGERVDFLPYRLVCINVVGVFSKVLPKRFVETDGTIEALLPYSLVPRLPNGLLDKPVVVFLVVDRLNLIAGGAVFSLTSFSELGNCNLLLGLSLSKGLLLRSAYICEKLLILDFTRLDSDSLE